MRMLKTRELKKARKDGNHETAECVIDLDSIVALFPKKHGTEVVMSSTEATFYSPWDLDEWIAWLNRPGGD